MLNVISHIPNGLLTTPPTELFRLLDQPTLIHLTGQREPPLFVSVLLHGNETSGYYAVQELLKKYQHAVLPRSLSIFIGNIAAAKFGKRRLDNQMDYNRIWPNSGYQPDAAEARLMQQVLDEMRRRGVFVSIDIHNNTGLNPHYACVNRMDNAFYQLAILFSRTVIYFIRPEGVQSRAFAEICPAVTVECGKTEHRLGITHALEYIESCLGLSELPDRPVLKQDMDLFHTVATVKVPPGVNFSFTESTADICFRSDLENLNFCELPAGTGIAGIRRPDIKPLIVTDEDGNEVYERFFHINQHRLVTRCDIMPSMLTIESDIIRKDCLCYLMERVHF
ncbi:MAG: M14 family metallopeptidase [Gammaproteobacteria bacterium]|nr:M14 family metallopeptidase [Gammaproteobacteria bacterium]